MNKMIIRGVLFLGKAQILTRSLTILEIGAQAVEMGNNMS